MMSSIEEGGVLPGGSRGFRSPEQAENGQDISFMIPSDQSSDRKLSTEIVIPSHFGTAPEAGDWLYTRDATGNGVKKSRMTKVVDGDAGAIQCSVPVKDLGWGDTSLQRSRIVKDVSLHSDIFSLGCIVYYLGSEGRDPERFMQTFADRITLAMIEATLPKWLVSSPLWMASVLCQQDEESLMSDIQEYINSLPDESVKPAELLLVMEGIELASDANIQATRTLAATRAATRLKLSSPKVEGIVGALGDLMQDRHLKQSSSEVKGIVAYRRNLRNNTSLKPLLTGKVSGEPISFAQLFLTLLCCLRDGESCIVRRSEKVVDDHGQCLEVYDASAHTYAQSILEVANRLGELKSLKLNLSKWASLGKSPLDIFMAARLSKSLLTPAMKVGPGNE